MALGVYFIAVPQRAEQQIERLRAAVFERHPGTVLLAVETKQDFQGRLGKLLVDASVPAGTCPMKLQASAYPKETIEQLRNGTATLGFALAGLSGEYNGLAAVAALGRQYAHVIVSADSKIQTFRDLAGKRLGVGPKDCPSETLAKAVVDYYQFAGPPELIAGHAEEWETAFRNGEIDALLLAAPLYAPGVEKLLATGWYRLVPILEAPALERYWPGLMADVIPEAVYGPDRKLPADTPGPTATVSVNTFLVARQDAPDAAIRSALDRVFCMDCAAARLAPLSEAQARETMPLRLHPAAEAYYRRHDPPVRREVNRACLFFLGWAGLLGGVWGISRAARRRRQAYRRRRLDTYFIRLSDCAQAIQAAENPAQLAVALRDMAAAQKIAERDWREGRLESGDAACFYGACAARSLDALHKVLTPQWWDEPARENERPPQEVRATRPAIDEPRYSSEEEPFPNNIHAEDDVVLGEVRPRSASRHAEPIPTAERVRHREEPPPSPPLPENAPPAPRSAQKTSVREIRPSGNKPTDEDEQLQLFQ